MDLRVLGDHVTARGKFVVPYVAWGMKDPQQFSLEGGEKSDDRDYYGGPDNGHLRDRVGSERTTLSVG